MLVRFSDVVYWFGCVLTLLMGVINVHTVVSYGMYKDDGQGTAILLAVSLVPWLVGRSFRYVIAGR